MTLRWRIALTLAAVALGVGVLAAVFAYLITASQLSGRIDESLRTAAAAANGAVVGGPGRPDGGHGGRDPGRSGDNVCPDAAIFEPASVAQVVAADGTVSVCLAGPDPLPLPVTGAARLPSGRGVVTDVRLDGHDYRLLSAAYPDGGVLQIARSLDESHAVLARLRLQLGLLIAAATGVAAVLGWLIATRLARPIIRLRDAAHRIAATLDMSTAVDVSGPGEVGSLAASFQTMVTAVARSQEQQRRLVSDASHEMRTPMTSLRSNVEIMRQIERLPMAERSDVIADVLHDIDELSSLMGELVDLASDLTASEPSEVVRVDQLARVAAARVERRTERCVGVVAAPVAVEGRPRQLERAIQNLIDNAVKYSEPGSPIEVEIDDTTLTVRDRAAGWPRRISIAFSTASTGPSQPARRAARGSVWPLCWRSCVATAGRSSPATVPAGGPRSASVCPASRAGPPAESDSGKSSKGGVYYSVPGTRRGIGRRIGMKGHG